ncbi:hypothetical protein M422DRAFT_60949 [Sphaerobolus stellatus SS14]|uniref:ABC transmembrane type-1 domain-containing protein n=1 Tax=Sphaerobolus stellatus (strain SS14) TaxID=990650 RepID=A0A0C9VJK4_SPHS4|nr:hypothetical protein M422DRAFT_60949 [Sphaerobolus stellatus SS14]
MPIDPSKLRLDAGNDEVRIRENWWQIWRPKHAPPPVPHSFDDAPVIPFYIASILSILTLSASSTDLWKMDPSREIAGLSKKLDECWERHLLEVCDRNTKVKSGDFNPTLGLRIFWVIKALLKAPKANWRRSYNSYLNRWSIKEPSLAWALNDMFGWQFWISGLMKIIGDTSQLMGPLLAIINFGKRHYAAKTPEEPVPFVGLGMGMAFGLFLVTVCSIIGQQQFFWRSISTGILARAALIVSVYRRGIFLQPSSRASLPNSALVNHISTDISRINGCAVFSARLAPARWTDRRANLVQELLEGVRVVKWFTYENPLLEHVISIRKQELNGIYNILMIRGANESVAYTISTLTAVLAFVTYSLTGNEFDPAILFSSLSLFQLLRQPLLFLPRSFSSITDAQSALIRLKKDFELDIALRVKGASFRWEGSESQPRQKGQLCAIVGPVGSEKSSLLLALLGEMRRIAGSCTFGGYWKVIRDACLIPDLEALPNRGLTEVSINDTLKCWSLTANLISEDCGGQRQRVRRIFRKIIRSMFF